MVTELQRLVDHLGALLKRSVAIDDAHVRLLAYSSHAADVDPVRVESVMQRRVSDDVAALIREHLEDREDEFFTVPAAESLGIKFERFGMPIRYNGSLLGYLWLVGSDGPIAEEEVAAARRSARQAGLILHQE